jgi:hypothetical protein
MQFTEISNPETTKETGEWTVRTYDSSTKSVLERSYPSTSNADTLTFVKGTTDNGTEPIGEISVYQGCYSDYFPIKLKKPTYDALTIKPSSTTSGIAFDPTELTYEKFYVQS